MVLQPYLQLMILKWKIHWQTDKTGRLENENNVYNFLDMFFKSLKKADQKMKWHHRPEVSTAHYLDHEVNLD